MRRITSFILPFVLVVAPAIATIGAAVAHADPELLGDRSPPRSVQLDYLPDPAMRRSCAPAEALAIGLSLEARREVVDANAAARLIVKLTRKGRVYTAMVEMRDEQGVTIYTNPYGPVHSCDMLLIDIEVGVGYLFRRADQEAAEKAAAEKAAAEKAAAEKAAAEKAASDKAAAEKAAADKSAADKDRIAAKPRPPRSWAWRVAASGGVAFLMAPSDVAGTMRLEGGIQWPLASKWHVSASLGGIFSPRASGPVTEPMTRELIHVGTLLAAGMVDGCIHRDIPPFGGAFGCVGFELGGWRAERTDTPRPVHAWATWAAIDPRLGVEVPFPYVPWLAAQLLGDVPLLLQQPPALVNPSMSNATSEVWPVHRVAPAVSLGLRALF